MRIEGKPPHALRRRTWLTGTSYSLGLGAVGCLGDLPLKLPIHYEPARRSGDWSIAEPDEVGLEPAAVRNAYELIFDAERLPNVRSALVARHGRLVAEGYVADRDDIDTRRALMSATKCFTSTLAGIALDRGDLPSLDVNVGDLLDESERYPDKAEITLRDTLTMRSGIDYSNDDFSLDMDWGGYDNSVARVLSKPLNSAPGKVFNYTDACVHVAGAMISRSTGAALDQYAKRHLFSPLGISRFDWLAHRDGLNYGAYGLYLTPRDLLRFSQGMLRAHNREGGVVSSGYLLEATTSQVEPNSGQGFGFGFYWWLAPKRRGFTAWGHGGQFAFFNPELDLALSITADPHSGEAETDGLDVLEFLARLTEGVR